jgi:hypothetical protein
MELSIEVLGKKINNMERVLRLGLMVHLTMDIILMERSMDLVNLLGLTRVSTTGILKKTILKAMASMSGPMEGSSMENGKTTKWMAMVNLTGLMSADTSANILMTRSKGMVFSTGLMVASTMVLG